jgi:methylenetetrahydrofolate reductase (NADPH)
VGSALRHLVAPFSVEITPREAKNLPPLQDVLTVGTAVYLTFLPRIPWPEMVAVARQITEAGMRPVPHLAARAVPDRAALRRMLADLAAVGVDDLLLVAGSLRTPVGEFAETSQILDSGCLEEAGILRVGVAGHPEGSPDIGDDELAAALATKNRIARERGLDVRIVTQFCFAAEPIVAWERRIRAAGNRLPVHVGLPGLTSPARLLRFGLSCGVGASLKVLRTQAGGMLKLASTSVYRPEETLTGLAAAVAADPRSLLRAVHFFPFGSLVPTAEWATGVRDGRIKLQARPSATA